MDARTTRRWVMLSAIGVALLTGCAERTWIERQSFWPFKEKKVPYDLGRPTPYEQITRLRQQAREAERGGADMQARVAAEVVPQLAGEEDPLIRQEIVRTLGYCRTPESAAALAQALDDPDAEVRETACEGWGRLRHPDAVAHLTRILRSDTQANVRLAAARALGETGESAAVPALGELLADQDPALQLRATESLEQITGKDFGNDTRRWQQYVQGEPVDPPRPISIAEQFRQLF